MNRDIKNKKDLRLLPPLLIQFSLILFLMASSFERAGAYEEYPLIVWQETGYIDESVFVRSLDRIPDATNDPELLFNAMIQDAAGRHMIDPALIKAVIKVESRFDPDAISEKGAKGLMQLMPKTAEALGVIDPLDPRDNIDGGARYLKNLLDRFNGNLKLTLAAYQAGCGKVNMFKGMPPYKTTQRYVRKVLEHYVSYKAKTHSHRLDHIWPPFRMDISGLNRIDY